MFLCDSCCCRLSGKDISCSFIYSLLVYYQFFNQSMLFADQSEEIIRRDRLSQTFVSYLTSSILVPTEFNCSVQGAVWGVSDS